MQENKGEFFFAPERLSSPPSSSEASSTRLISRSVRDWRRGQTTVPYPRRWHHKLVKHTHAVVFTCSIVYTYVLCIRRIWKNATLFSKRLTEQLGYQVSFSKSVIINPAPQGSVMPCWARSWMTLSRYLSSGNPCSPGIICVLWWMSFHVTTLSRPGIHRGAYWKGSGGRERRR